MAEKTIGQKIVRTDFNVGKDDDVSEIKLAFADLIDLVGEKLEYKLEVTTDEEAEGEAARLGNTAIYSLETAAMYAVKAITT